MKKSLTLLFFTLLFFKVFSQQIIPPSPVTEEFNKYINFNTSYYNGLPEISIPLYTIKIKGVSIPINLSYHASGIKYKQDDTNVGVGWTLNPGYRVSRTIYGHPDELKSKPGNLADSINYYAYNQGSLQMDNFLAKFLEPSPYQRPSSYNGGIQYDGEFDIFNFSTPDESGTFIISDRVNKGISNAEYSNLKTDYSVGLSSNGFTHGIIGLQIKDTQGNKYSFGEWKQNNGNFVFETNSSYQGYAATAWALTDVENQFGENVHFHYNQRSDGKWLSHIKNISISEAVRFPITTGGFNDYIPSSISEVSSGVDGSYSTFSLQNITTSQERVEFNRTVTQFGSQVSEILVYRNDNSLLKKIKFYYSYNNYHAFLDSVSVFDSSLANVQTHRFEYYDKNINSVVLVPDQWGYYKVEANQYKVFHSAFASDMVFLSNGGAFPTQQTAIGQYLPDYAERENLTEVPKYFTLKKIIYPTGGFTEYEFEHNYYKDGQSAFKAGGIRIKRIQSGDFSGQLLSRRFVYGKNEDGNGYPSIYITPGMFVNESYTMRFDPLYHTYIQPQRILSYNSNLQGDIESNIDMFGNVTYPEVAEYYSYSNNETGIGKTIYSYDLGGTSLLANSFPATIFNSTNIPVPSQYHYGYPLYMSDYSLWDKPTLVQKKVFKEIAGANYLIRKEQYDYDLHYTIHEGLKVRPFATAEDYSSLNSEYYNFISSFFNYGTYTFKTGLKRLIKEEVTEYSGDSLKIVKFLNYNSLNQISKETSSNSKGETLQTQIAHPIDKVQAGQDPSGIYLNMVNHNILTPVIEEIKSNNSNQTDFVRTNYHSPFSDMFLPQTVEIQGKSTDPLQTRMRYLAYDNKANPLTVTQNEGPKTSYKWGHNQQYPIAEVKNASQNEFHAENFEESHTYQGNIVVDNARAHTGLYSGRLTNYGTDELVCHGNIWTPVNLTAPKKFTYSGWIYSDGPSAQIFLFMMRPGEPAYFSYVDNVDCYETGKWVYVQKEVEVPGDVANLFLRLDNNGGGNVWFDDLRIYPAAGQMNTYTYQPLVGMTSQTDTKGQTTYYEYDSFQRLLYIKDQYGNIVKSFDYHYKP